MGNRYSPPRVVSVVSRRLRPGRATKRIQAEYRGVAPTAARNLRVAKDVALINGVLHNQLRSAVAREAQRPSWEHRKSADVPDFRFKKESSDLSPIGPRRIRSHLTP